MSRTVSNGGIKGRPSTLQSAKSFTRFEPARSSAITGRNRASTVQPSKSIPADGTSDKSPVSPRKFLPTARTDVFEKTTEEDEESLSPSIGRSSSLPDRFDELPIEVASLVDRFVESLGAKVYSEPPSIEKLSDLFQEFYIRAGSTISIHISTLLSRLGRDSSPSPARTASSSSKIVAKRPSLDSIDVPDKSQQMLTASEVSEKRKARRLLEYKRLVLEEAVERRACEKIYDKIWRHKNTLDEVRDEKLRSKTAALALVGIGLRDLGIELDSQSSKTPEDVQESLAPAREELAKMNDENYPLGKLQHLTRAHKSIVDTLYTIYPSTSSADEILPTLIYTLITSPLEGINIISNLQFVQRFRNANKIDGEAAYCLTNLEAAISFLENVDLASLRKDELPEGPPKSSSRPTSPTMEKPDPFPSLAPSSSTTAETKSSASASNLQSPSRSAQSAAASLPTPRHQRTLSNLLQPSAKVIGAANDAVRNTAEEGFKNISNTLDNSFKFLFGRLKEHSQDDTTGEVVVPKTLDEARQLVSRPMTPSDDVLDSEASSFFEKETESPVELPKQDDKLLSIIGGRKPGSIRERSVDSIRSTGSGKKVAFAATGTPSDPMLGQKVTGNAGNNPLDSVKNLGNSFNPLNHIGSAFGGGFRTFSKAVSPSPPMPPITDKRTTSDPALSVPKSVAGETLSIEPPIQRFMDIKDAGDLTMKDVPALLQDYQRLAQVLKGLSQG